MPQWLRWDCPCISPEVVSAEPLRDDVAQSPDPLHQVGSDDSWSGQRQRVVLTLRKTMHAVRAEGEDFEYELEAFVSMLIVAAEGEPSADQTTDRDLQIIRIGAATARGPEPHIEVELEVGGVPARLLREALTPAFFRRLRQLDDAACQALGEQLVCPATVEPVPVWLMPINHQDEPEPEPEPELPLQSESDLLLPPPLAFSHTRSWSRQFLYAATESSCAIDTERQSAMETLEAHPDEDLTANHPANDGFEENLSMHDGSRAGAAELTDKMDPGGGATALWLSTSTPRRLTRTEIAQANDQSSNAADASFVTARGEFSVLASPAHSMFVVSPPLTRTISAYE